MSKRIRKTILLLLAIVMLSALAISATMATATSGSCGKSVRWSYDDGVLTISGEGAMTSFSSVTAQPWQGYKEEISKVVIE